MILRTNDCIPLQKWNSEDEFETHILEFKEHNANGDEGNIQPRKTWYFIRDIKEVEFKLKLFRQLNNKRNQPDTARASFQYLVWLKSNITIP